MNTTRKLLTALATLGISLGALAGTASAAPVKHRIPANVGYDGDFKFVVTSVPTCETSDPTLSIPRGSWECMVDLTVTNVKSQAQFYFASDQYGHADGRTYSADSTAAFMIGTADNAMAQVNPGVTIHVTVPYQLPNGQGLAYMKLHDSSFSMGVKVQFPAKGDSTYFNS